MDDPLQSHLDDLASQIRQALRDQLKVQQLLDELGTALPELADIANRLTILGQDLAQLKELPTAVASLLASLKSTSRPHRRRAVIATAALVLLSTLATVFAITASHPGWTLRERERHQLEVGALILDRYPRLPSRDQKLLEELLARLSQSPEPSSATSPP
ncbi:MAG TPA: hypothetical protein VE078_06020 [Thermoanaerobaculia bacterium]|nr:hypothetical protein [Thermoanaerobaculia bacterium]